MKPIPITKREEIEARIRALHEEMAALTEATVAGCSHPVEDIRELPHTESTGKPWLICSRCGYTEEGWYCGYKKTQAR